MNRVCCFSHYDAHGIIQDYVVYYLAELKKIADTIIFVSDSQINDEELSKIKPYADYINAEPHGEYDFGSYKRGFFYAKDNNLLENCDELIFANDSCYAPLYPFNEMFSKMSDKNLDFWGVTENYEGVRGVASPIKHVQSYFLVFKPQVFQSKCFSDFMAKIKKEKKDLIIANYELGLSALLVENNFKYDVFCELSKIKNTAYIKNYKELIKENKNPFLKRSILLYRYCDMKYPVFTKFFIEKYTEYNYELIKNDVKANKNNISYLKKLKFFWRSFRRSIISVHIIIKEVEITVFGKNYKIFQRKETV